MISIRGECRSAVFFLPLLFLAVIFGFPPEREVIAASKQEAGCPDSNQGETAEDCPWAKIARDLTLEANHNRPLVPALETALPGFVEQIRKDSRNQAAKKLWGKSINFDEYVKEVIVHPAILASLGQIFGAESNGRIVHAGLEHTYGYLLSVLKTPFGFKRARWVRSTLEEGFGIPSKTLSPLPSEGTFFSNITYFLGKIAFRSDPNALKQLERAVKSSAPKGIPKTLIDFPYDKLHVIRLAETVNAKDERGKQRAVTLRTDLVPFHAIQKNGSNSHLLIYSIVDPSQGGARLVTAFPVEKSFVEKVLNPANLGTDKPVAARYNAYVEGINNNQGDELKGERRVIQSGKSRK